LGLNILIDPLLRLFFVDGGPLSEAVCVCVSLSCIVVGCELDTSIAVKEEGSSTPEKKEQVGKEQGLLKHLRQT